jgi:hypothetical protein
LYLFSCTKKARNENLHSLEQPSKQQRNTITLEEKLNVINRPENVKTLLMPVVLLVWPQSILRTICDNTEEVRKPAKLGTKVSNIRVSYSVCLTMERMENTCAWIEEQN